MDRQARIEHLTQNIALWEAEIEKLDPKSNRAQGIQNGIEQDRAELEVLIAGAATEPTVEELAEAKAQELIQAKKLDELVAAKVAEIDTSQPEKPDS